MFTRLTSFSAILFLYDHTYINQSSYDGSVPLRHCVFVLKGLA